MKIYTYSTMVWDGVQYTLDKNGCKWYDYSGPVDKYCGATAGQQQVGAAQTSLFNTLTSQASSVFGSSSSVFNDLVNTFSPIVSAGPDQQGFSPQELASLNSQAITNTGQAYNNAKQAVGEQEAAVGGGNTPGLATGSNIGINLGVANSAAQQTSSELNQITQANYATGRQNWVQAVGGLAGAPGVFNPATNAGGEAVGAGSAAGNTQNQIAQEQNGWVNALIGAGSQIAGTAAGAAGFNGGGSTPDADINQIGWNQSNPFSQGNDNIIAPTNSAGVLGTVPGS